MIKVLFVNEYFPPYAPGGGEWSTYYLANDLSNKKLANVIVMTPDYGDRVFKEKRNFKLTKFPFYKKINGDNKILPSLYHTNLIWFLWEAFYIIKIAKKFQIDVLHVHGKYSIPAARIANLFLRKPILITIRDYQIICNYGFCLFNKDISCNLKEYFTSDFVSYYNYFVKSRNLIIIGVNLIYAIWGRFSRNIIKAFASGLETIVLSEKQKQIFKNAGFKKVQVIHNSITFPAKAKVYDKNKVILFAGRLTYGKGVGLIINILPEFFKKFPDYLFYFAGEGQYKNELIGLSKIYPQIKVLGSVTHQKLLEIYSQATLTVVPSLWPEPFGRIALESLRSVTPVVITDKGGLPEIVEDGKWGYVVKANVKSLMEGISKGIINNKILEKNIFKDFEIIKKKFGQDISNKYSEQYMRLLEK